jgi:hypothetical protein
MLNVIGMVLGIVTFFLNKWSKNEQLKADWKKLVDSSLKQYNEKQATESVQIKKDYDDLDSELSKGKYKL